LAVRRRGSWQWKGWGSRLTGSYMSLAPPPTHLPPPHLFFAGAPVALLKVVPEETVADLKRGFMKADGVVVCDVAVKN